MGRIHGAAIIWEMGGPLLMSVKKWDVIVGEDSVNLGRQAGEMTDADPDRYVIECITFEDGKPTGDISFVGKADRIKRIANSVLAEKVRSAVVAEYASWAPPNTAPVKPTAPEVDDTWADNETFKRIKEEVEERAKGELETSHLLYHGADVSSDEPIATIQVFEKSASIMLAPSGIAVHDDMIHMGFPPAWDVGRGKHVKVAVLDTGCNRSHPCIAGRVREVIDCTGTGGGERDTNGHGTFCVSQILSNLPAKDPFGGAYEVDMYPIQVLRSDQGWGGDSWIARGIDTAVRLGCNVLSMSIGGGSPMPLTKQALDRAEIAGCVVCVAAGNDGPSVPDVSYPARYDTVIAVGAANGKKVASSFSQCGPSLDVWACGVAQPGAVGASGYGYWSGTSMATPHVSAAAALAVGRYIALGMELPNAKEMKADVCTLVSEFKSGRPNQPAGTGLLNAGKLVLDITKPTDPTPPPDQPDPVLFDVPHTESGTVTAVMLVASWLLNSKPGETLTLRRVNGSNTAYGRVPGAVLPWKPAPADGWPSDLQPDILDIVRKVA